MTESNLIYLLIALGLATALISGVLLTFSDFVMRALNVSSRAAGAEAMQMVNREVYRSVFMVLFMGLVPATILMSVYAYFSMDGAARNYVYFASAFYLVGVFLITGLGNVPMNIKLEGLPIGGAAAQKYWPTYFKGWMVLNHIRSAAALVSSAGFIQAALHLARAI